MNINTNTLRILFVIVLLLGQSTAQSYFQDNTISLPIGSDCDAGIEISADLQTLACFESQSLRIYRANSEMTYNLFQTITLTDETFQEIHSISGDGLLISASILPTDQYDVNPVRITAADKNSQYSSKTIQYIIDMTRTGQGSVSNNGRYLLAPRTYNYTLCEFTPEGTYTQLALITHDRLDASLFSPDQQFLLIISVVGGYAKVIRVSDQITVGQMSGIFYDVDFFHEEGFIYFSYVQQNNHFITKKCPSTGGSFELVNDYEMLTDPNAPAGSQKGISTTTNLAVIVIDSSIAIFERNTGEPYSTAYANNNGIITMESLGIKLYLVNIFSNPNSLPNTVMAFLDPNAGAKRIYYLGPPQIDCSTDVGSTGTQLPNGQCQCLSYHYWDSSVQKCLPHCKNHLAAGKNSDDATKCLCQAGASWDQVKRQCTLNCLTTKYSTGQQEWPEVCECKFGSNWNPDTLSCQLNCTAVRKADTFNDAVNECTCLTDYAWDSDTLTCNKQCAETTSQTGIVLEDDTCECKTGYQFDYYTSSCISLNCDVIPFATGFTADRLGCNCQDSFKWDATLKLCIVDCENIVDPLGLGTNLNYYACQCESGSAWENSALSCVRDCTLIANSTGTNVNSVECQCKVGFTWENNLCITSCGLKVGEADTYNTAESRCDCLANYYWSYENNACFRDCTNEESAIPVEGPDADSCYCYPGYAWETQCTLSCNAEFDVAVSSTTPGECQCETNAFFIASKNKCMVKCNEDPISTGQFSVDRCVCKANSEWNDQTNECQCIAGYTFNESTKYCESSSASAVVLGVVGGAIGSGSLIFMGLFMKQRSKRRAEDNEVVVEVRESVQKIAAKEEQI